VHESREKKMRSKKNNHFQRIRISVAHAAAGAAPVFADSKTVIDPIEKINVADNE